ncbi:bifunctional 4-hydroxy-2-oxoglutarate aldolase/2-dehydro-3-deoxy-phosphogluconate aldolase [Enterococcus cecorum]|uniref:bifunctional 4-hydroxy-2-oxoglutarate aldolase/2-dehydro-3-deoxy-phosphogluconate aldolase n=1 Tax=Enterococcus cecorum TaxID=44008 RepID=UPI000DE95AF1|nr:bifunctional 4-hydroxy-2-oxoglutarate aldolase/2-dehydro-3-deoxy-phosphogluconate aldolase [Enterococcus cecorum]RBR37065.1 2-dehydro-3-deoxyphosphogluconate aldolase/4-hydroxy-2-oxoglutarate aldolase [Enterococcus cecorum]
MNITIENLYRQLEETRLLPLYTVKNLDYLDSLEKVLLETDIKLIEVTFRSNLALPAIKKLSQSGNLIVGAGTVRNLSEAKSAVENGAQFIVSPALSEEVVEYCLDNSIPIFPGIATPRDIQRAVDYGIKTVKFFPADIYGGLKAIKALSGPFYDVKFLPTGGINEDNFIDYLNNKKIIAVGGSFIISEGMMKDVENAKNHLLKLREKIRELV